ncbi:3',5'-cyclic-nucleotide phosphodiesterase [Elizabethkingia argentiflava]|uniref:3',5'-cyclic-nucleotide phosphodiesterase n=1 Tax=Elizabethkingia argenteiflava TaxID=2681556 RepID=A0A845PW77_9FLAO|nr:3',5'-cyclic-nucleotide phosphodiesterase [Elizabethkingia argenteiflava]NAW51423.1 3',5'-cyclic-nucleotide phosphodiesterase [Elizabethkingia argenteiflava]
MKKILLSLLFNNLLFLNAQSFDLIPLGVYGGIQENNLSAYLIGEKGENKFLCLDAGTLKAGIDKAIEKGTFSTDAETVLKDYIKGYFISHGHLDHLAGMVINSPEDSKKNIYSTPETAEVLKQRYFTQDAWINFANEGTPPILGKYTYKKHGNTTSFPIEATAMSARIFPLSHGNPYKSSAILVTNTQKESVLYLGDTGADRNEKSSALKNLWRQVAPLVKNKSLKAILIEVSFENERPENALFGHLTPQLLNEEFSILAQLSDARDLRNLKIIITHLKPGDNRIEIIKKQLMENNPMKVQIIFPEQGQKIQL